METWQEIVKNLPRPRFRKWAAEMDILSGNELLGVTRTGFEVTSDYGTQIVDFATRLTDEHYNVYAPLVDDWGKAQFAQVVLDNMLDLDDWCDREAGWSILKRDFGADVEAWLPEAIQGIGFSVLLGLLHQALQEHWQTHARRRFHFTTMPVFNWDGALLTFGCHQWKFRNQRGPTQRYLDALKKAGWQPVRIDGLDPDQTRETRKVLQEKTRGKINWHASNDGRLSWSIPKSPLPPVARSDS